MQYDANNRLTGMVDAVGTTQFGYADFGALLSEDGPFDSDTVSYAYTTNQLRSGLTLLQPSGASWQQNYSYDPGGPLTNVVSPAGSFGYQYDSICQLQVSKITLPNGSYVANQFDGLARLTSTYLKNSSDAVLNSHAYVYDAANRRTQQTRTAGDYINYSYDEAGQLQPAVGQESGGTTNRPHEQFGYGYDAAWNLNFRTNNALVQTFTVDGLYQLTNVGRSGNATVSGTTWGPATNVTLADNGNSPVAALRYADATFARTNVTLLNGTNTFTAVAQDSYGRADTNTVTAYLPATVTLAYDGNGNLTTNGTRFFEYDSAREIEMRDGEGGYFGGQDTFDVRRTIGLLISWAKENQLVRVTEPGAWKSEVAYDGRMRRRMRTEYLWSRGAWQANLLVRYVYDGMVVVQERHYNPQISPTSPQLVVTSTRGLDFSGNPQGAGGIGGLLARTDQTPATSQHTFYHSDGNGNVTCLINNNQRVVARYLYDPFGNMLAASGTLAEANLYRFSGQEWHENSALVNYAYRHYSPSLQRWLNRDPIEETGGLNLYAYAANDPINEADPLGLKPNRATWEDVIRTLGDWANKGRCISKEIQDAIRNGRLNNVGLQATLTKLLGVGAIPQGMANALAAFPDDQDCMKMLCDARIANGDCAASAKLCALGLGAASGASPAVVAMDVEPALIKYICHDTPGGS